VTNSRAVLQDIAALVGIPSVSSALADRDMPNRALIDYLAGRMEAQGFDLQLQETAGGPGKRNLIGSLGRGAGGLVLAGHTDTVACDPGTWQSDPFVLSERNGRLYGLGVCDMKAFFALALAAAAEFEARELRRPLVILATADEETSMAGARALAATGQAPGRYAVIGEPTGLRPVRSHKGILMERIRVHGHSGHSSDPSLGRNAIEAMQRVLVALLEWRAELQRAHFDPAFDIPTPTLNLGRIHGGDNPNRICGNCELDIDLRPLPGMSLTSLRAELHDRARHAVAGSGCSVSFEVLFGGIEAMSTPADSPLVRAAEELTGTMAEAVAFATEAPFFAQLGTDVLILGPGSIAQAHQPDEYLELARLQPMLEVLRRLIRQFCCD
jgi:acetylornithine deacetylase